MFSIGEFARHGRVSVRMLRHYDAIGLLQPACVDPVTGYRFYRAGQLADLNRVIALKELGFSLQQVQAILGDRVSAAELRGMLRLRQAEIRAQIDAETTRLNRVEARLLTIEDEARTPVDGVIVKRLPVVRVAELAGPAAGYEPDAITPVIQSLYCDLWGLMAAAGVAAAGPAVAYYRDAPDGDGAIVVHAAVPVTTAADPDHGLSVTNLPEIERAAMIIHHGRMDDVLVTGQALARWIDAHGYHSTGYAREVTLEWSADPDNWVTELQQPITPTGG
jgi:DNA-binding transcriptional MerR regulator/effector-binding domain-containing protein